MTTGVDRATHMLRERLLMGQFTPEEKIGEIAVASDLGVSRTLARLAMGALEREGLLVREPRRGFRVRSFSIDDIIGAIEVRGELEAMAVRVISERGLTEAQEARLTSPLDQTDQIFADGAVTIEKRLRWTEMNREFHDAIIEEAGIEALKSAYHHVTRIPLVSPVAIVFDMGDPEFSRPQLERAQDDHRRILDAIRRRKSVRAAEIMRDHSIRSGENKHRNLANMQTRDYILSMPGAALIALE